MRNLDEGQMHVPLSFLHYNGKRIISNDKPTYPHFIINRKPNREKL